ncbi:hypothetical protein Plhal304r1_c036g0110721 [Plasmopara halstedii]
MQQHSKGYTHLTFMIVDRNLQDFDRLQSVAIYFDCFHHYFLEVANCLFSKSTVC